MEQRTDQTSVTKEFLRQALFGYAECFESLVQGQRDACVELRETLEHIDRSAERSLSGEQYKVYQQRKTYLCRLFRNELMGRLNGQLRVEIMHDVEELANFYEQGSMRPEPANRGENQ